MKVLIMIPARYDSTRLPGKPLIDCNGNTLVQRTCEQTCKVKGADVVVVSDMKASANATYNVVQGIDWIVSSCNHRNGTQRIADTFQCLYADDGYDVVVNWQVDEPLIDPREVEAMCRELHEELPKGSIATLCCGIGANSINATPRAIVAWNRCYWFTRKFSVHSMHHVGIYAFHASDMAEIASVPTCKAAELEGLEQLEWIAAGFDVYWCASKGGLSINTPEDHAKYVEVLKAGEA